MKMAEKEITSSILKYLKGLSKCFCWKEHGGMYGTAGIPDIICCYRGRFVAFEVKAKGNKPTKLQEAMIRRINEAGGTALTVYSLEDVKKIIMKVEEM